ncbi:MAG: hypothetical protein FJ242_00115 [Nitrospira sp.]|nr:hypothetical protein [Nitrospira sp.]
MMKKLLSIGMLFIIAIGLVIIESDDVYAMNNESAAMLAGAIAIFGKPVLNAIAGEIFYPTYYNSYPVYNSYYNSYPVQTGVIYQTAPIYDYDSYYIPYNGYGRGYDRGYSRGYKRGYRRGWDDCEYYSHRCRRY